MQVKRKLALLVFTSGLALGAASVEAAPIAGVSQAAPAVSASESTTAPMIQKTWWHRRWHRWHHWHHW